GGGSPAKNRRYVTVRQADDTRKTICDLLLVPGNNKIVKGELAGPIWRGRLTRLGVQGNILRCWFPDSNRGRKREHGHDKFEHSNLTPSVAAPATVSGEL